MRKKANPLLRQRATIALRRYYRSWQRFTKAVKLLLDIGNERYKEECRKASRRWAHEHKELVLAYGRIRRATHRAASNAYQAAYKRAHRYYCRKYQQEWRAKNPDKIKQYNHDYIVRKKLKAGVINDAATTNS
jgi:hypothetical protein